MFVSTRFNFIYSDTDQCLLPLLDEVPGKVFNLLDKMMREHRIQEFVSGLHVGVGY